MVAATGQPVEWGVLAVLVYGATDLDELCVAQHHVERGMPQEEPQRVHVAAGFQVASGEVVAESVRTAAGSHPGPALQAVDHDFDGVRGKGLAAVGLPHLIATLLPCLGEVDLQGFPRLAVDGYHPELGTLTSDSDLLQLGIQLRELHAGQLAEAQAGIDEDGDNGLVPDAEEAVAILDIVFTDGEHGVHLVVGVRLHILVAGAGEFQAQRRAFLQVLLFRGPVEEGLGHLEVVMDRGRGRLAVGVAAAIAGPAVRLASQILHEVAKVVAGDFCWLWPVILGSVVEQPVEAHLVVFQRPGGEAPARTWGDVAAQREETGDELVQGEGLGPCCCNHFSF